MFNKINFKKLGFKPVICVAVVSFQLLISSSFSQNPGGTTGSLTWEFNTSTRTLRISGNDTMPNYKMYSNGTTDAPWFPYLLANISIEIEEGGYKYW